MLVFKKLIFNRDFAVIKDTKKMANNQGIVDIDGNIVLKCDYEHIYEPIGKHIIVSRRYNSFENPSDVYYGLINDKFKEVISPCLEKYRGYYGYFEIEHIISQIQEKNYISSLKEEKYQKILEKKN